MQLQTHELVIGLFRDAVSKAVKYLKPSDCFSLMLYVSMVEIHPLQHTLSKKVLATILFCRSKNKHKASLNSHLSSFPDSCIC